MAAENSWCNGQMVATIERRVNYVRRHEVRGVAHKVSVYLFGNCESARQLRFGSGQSKIRDTGGGCPGSNGGGVRVCSM